MPLSNQQQNPYAYINGPLVCEQFEGINTSTSRAGVPAEQMRWCDGFMPLDKNHLRTLYDVGPTLYTAVGTTIVFFYFVNISSTPYAVVFLANGAVVAVNVNTSAVMSLLPAASIQSPSQTNIGISQWGQQYVIIVANQTNGYWIWDGTAVYDAGSISPVVTITNVGSGYVSPPVISLVGGSGFGAAFSGQIANGSLVSIVVTNAGQNYLSTDTPTVIITGGTTSGSGASINGGLAHHVGGAGASVLLVMENSSAPFLANASLVSGGSGYSNAPVVLIAGGNPYPGSPVPITCTVTAGVITGLSVQGSAFSRFIPFGSYINFGGPNTLTITDPGYWFVNSTTIIAPGSGYSNFPQLSITGANTTIVATPVLTASVSQPAGSISSVQIVSGGQYTSSVAFTIVITDTATTAQATVTLMPYGVSGNAVETYSGHVWVVNKNLYQWSAPGSVSNFATNLGGGSATSASSYLKIGYTRLVSTNGFLYLVADSSIDYISGVQTSGMVPTTTFTLQNATPTIGTPYPWSVILRGQDLLFANSIGVYTLPGANPQKVSQMLDGYWGSVPNFNGLNLSSAHAQLFSREVWMTLSTFVDVVTGQTVTKPSMWDGKRWWTSPQSMSMTYIASNEINSVFTAYGTNGTIIAPLFSAPSNAFTKTVRSKLWADPGGYALNHAAGRFWGIMHYYAVTVPSLTLLVDAVSTDPASGSIVATSAGYTITGPLTTGPWATPPLAIGQQGILTGFTLETNCGDMAVVSALIDNEPTAFRG